MLRKLLCGTALAALAAAPALAADMSYPVKAAPVAYAPVPVFSWTGFYIGANAGYGWTDVGGTNAFIAAADDYYFDFLRSGSLQPEGWFGGLQAGYNYQFDNNVVLGVEADVQFADMNENFNYSGYSQFVDIDNNIFQAGTISSKVETFGTIRARLGYAVDRFLPYITGGVAWADIKRTEVVVSNAEVGGVIGPDVVTAASYSDTSWGWTLGAGGEYAITDNWTVKAEYLYADVGSSSFSGVFNHRDLDYAIQTVKAGVNYKF
ncbi:outer membrane protein [Ancylobacter terrae]|uniref:outer membrane protein n=1 Tax=Ancylobacter sp. sgz301288 TaxID=3342077 RepID=UPI00385D93B6